MKEKINALLGSLFNLSLIKKSSKLLYEQAFRDYNEIDSIDFNTIDRLHKALPNSKSQIKQDLFVLYSLDFKKSGFFVEFGATNGINLSNSYLLETQFGWNGILAEPAKVWHSDLKKNRSCAIETDCVWKKTGDQLTFNEVEDPELSTVSAFNASDLHKQSRKSGESYLVNTISLLDLLKKYNAPKIIDYLSIDTEGSEFEILRNFDFNQYSFRVITCEHNKTTNREKIYNLLKSKGYKRKFTGFSKFDDWYVKEDI